MNDPRVGLDPETMNEPKNFAGSNANVPTDRRRSGSWDFGLARMFSMGRHFPEDVANEVPSFPRQRTGSVSGANGESLSGSYVYPSIDSSIPNADSSIDRQDRELPKQRRNSFVSQMFAQGRFFPEDAAGGIRRDRD